MTITVCVLVQGGIVLAADSRQVTKSPLGQLRVDSDNADKIFQLGSHLAVSVYGQGFFYPSGDESPQNIGMIVHSAAKHLPGNCTAAEAAAIVHQKVTEDVERHCGVTGVEQASVAFHVAGYDPNSDAGGLYHCEVPGGVALERQTSDAGVVWSGQREIINRLILGYDPRLLELLTISEDRTAAEDALRQKLRGLQLHLNSQTMPLQDAVDLAVFLVHATIELQRLSDGIVGDPGQFPTCGNDWEFGLGERKEVSIEQLADSVLRASDRQKRCKSKHQ